MNDLSKFKEFSITKDEKSKVVGGLIEGTWLALCNGLYNGIGTAQLEGDKAAASYFFQTWVSLGC